MCLLESTKSSSSSSSHSAWKRRVAPVPRNWTSASRAWARILQNTLYFAFEIYFHLWQGKEVHIVQNPPGHELQQGTHRLPSGWESIWSRVPQESPWPWRCKMYISTDKWHTPWLFTVPRLPLYNTEKALGKPYKSHLKKIMLLKHILFDWLNIFGYFLGLKTLFYMRVTLRWWALPGMTPPQNPTSTQHWPRAAATCVFSSWICARLVCAQVLQILQNVFTFTFVARFSGEVVGGRALRGMSTWIISKIWAQLRLQLGLQKKRKKSVFTKVVTPPTAAARVAVSNLENQVKAKQ